MDNSIVVTNDVRFAYLNVVTPRQNKLSGKEEYSCTLLISKEDKETLDKVNGAIDFAKNQKWPGKQLTFKNQCLKDGDGLDSEGRPYPEEYHHCFALNVKAKVDFKPKVVNENREPIEFPEEFKSGDYGRAVIRAYAYDAPGNKGVAFGLNAIQKRTDGDPLNGGPDYTTYFD